MPIKKINMTWHNDCIIKGRRGAKTHRTYLPDHRGIIWTWKSSPLEKRAVGRQHQILARTLKGEIRERGDKGKRGKDPKDWVFNQQGCLGTSKGRSGS
jgi:hypothetical protein